MNSASVKHDPAPFDAMDLTVTTADIAARLHTMDEEANRRHFEDRAADYLKQLQRKFEDPA